jgi:hypothetical protein
MEITIGQALIGIIGVLLAVLLTMLVNLVSGMRKDFRDFVVEQRTYNERLIKLEAQVHASDWAVN